MNDKQIAELLLQSLEHERGGIRIYETAVQCAREDELRTEWKKYLEQTKKHERVLVDALEALGLDAGQETPGRKILRELGASLVKAMQDALALGDPDAAQIVACECVVLAETKDHLDWELIGMCADKATGKQKQVLMAAYEAVEDQEDEHLYHTRGWCRELWVKSLGMRAVLPPPEEERQVKTAIGAARAEQSVADRR